MKILFICTGNTCRSPMAEALFRQQMKDIEGIEIRSAGLVAFPGQGASPHTETILREKGINSHHISEQLDEELLQWADLVLTMTFAHKQTILSYFPTEINKVYTLKEYSFSSVDENGNTLNEDFSFDIEDPFGGNLDIYRQSATDIERALQQLEKKILVVMNKSS